ncbi:UNVERIFIED_CONTAM: hypothetical protein Sradi_0707600 [Sesamum radiatum]|uniref:Uncharacterized protein n=1 Tax=Sesamum radiatum TaxID=300843 RepID=A0AAW2VQU1_SESRA
MNEKRAENNFATISIFFLIYGEFPISNREFVVKTHQIGAFITLPMPPKQALEEAITALSDKLTELTTSWELRHEPLAAVLSDIQLQLAARPVPSPPPLSPSLSIGSSALPPSTPAHLSQFPLLKPPKL